MNRPSYPTIFMILIVACAFLMPAIWSPTRVSAAEGGSALEQFSKGIIAYGDGDYKTAQKQFLGLILSGISNGSLYYNLGNAYLKDGQIGPAVLWYERARKRMPADPDLDFNITYAQSLIVDEAERVENPVGKILFFWRHWLSESTAQWVALALNAVLWGFLVYSVIRPGKTVFRFRLPVMALAVMVLAVTMADTFDVQGRSDGVILPEKAVIRAGLNSDATELFVLHAGSKVRIQKELSGHYQVLFSKEKLGWVEKGAVGRICF